MDVGDGVGGTGRGERMQEGHSARSEIERERRGRQKKIREERKRESEMWAKKMKRVKSEIQKEIRVVLLYSLLTLNIYFMR